MDPCLVSLIAECMTDYDWLAAFDVFDTSRLTYFDEYIWTLFIYAMLSLEIFGLRTRSR
jgi:hypothetical protein